jgi:hypothetical protein
MGQSKIPKLGGRENWLCRRSNFPLIFRQRRISPAAGLKAPSLKIWDSAIYWKKGLASMVPSAMAQQWLDIIHLLS